MKLTAQVTAHHGNASCAGSVNGRRIAIDRHAPGGRSGDGMTFGELLCLAAGAGYVDALLREAGRREIHIDRAHVTVEGDAQRLKDLTITLRVETDGDEATTMEVIEHADRVSEALKLLRLGAVVRLADVHVLTRG
jgi:uncharacterized OsmC-like protein